MSPSTSDGSARFRQPLSSVGSATTSTRAPLRSTVISIRGADGVVEQQALQRLRVAERGAVDGEDHVAAVQAARRGRAVLDHLDDAQRDALTGAVRPGGRQRSGALTRPR